jgi:hypothetical protein
VAYANIYWAKQIANAVGGGLIGKPVTVLSAEPLSYDTIQKKGGIATMGPLRMGGRTDDTKTAEALIAINPGGEGPYSYLVLIKFP